MRTKSLILLGVLGAGILTAIVPVKAQGVFGNSPIGGTAFSIANYAGNAWGGAVSFTPVKDFSLASATIWLTGYAAQGSPQNVPILSAAICNDSSLSPFQPPGSPSQPFQTLATLNTPTANDGSLAAFTFNTGGTLTLQANTKYWFFIYCAGPHGNGVSCSWVGGGIPLGDAVYGGSDSFSADSFTSSSATPAFALNPVPEPGPCAIMTLSLLILGGRALRARWNSKKGE